MEKIKGTESERALRTPRLNGITATSEAQDFPKFILGAAIGCLAIRDELSLLDNDHVG